MSDETDQSEETGFKPPEGFAEKREDYLQSIREGMRPGAAAEFHGFRRADVLELIDSDPNLAKEVHYAELEATELVEEALFQAAVSGNVPASRVWLEMRGKMPTPSAGNSRQSQAPAAAPVGAVNPFDELDNVLPLDPAKRRSS